MVSPRPLAVRLIGEVERRQGVNGLLGRGWRGWSREVEVLCFGVVMIVVLLGDPGGV